MVYLTCCTAAPGERKAHEGPEGQPRLKKLAAAISQPWPSSAAGTVQGAAATTSISQWSRLQTPNYNALRAVPFETAGTRPQPRLKKLAAAISQPWPCSAAEVLSACSVRAMKPQTKAAHLVGTNCSSNVPYVDGITKLLDRRSKATGPPKLRIADSFERDVLHLSASDCRATFSALVHTAGCSRRLHATMELRLALDPATEMQSRSVWRKN